MVEYHNYRVLHDTLESLSREPKCSEKIKEELFPIFRSNKLFYHKSEAVYRFLDEVVRIVNDEELLDLIYSKIDIISLKLIIGIKSNSRKKLLDTISSSYYYMSPLNIEYLLDNHDKIDIEIIARALDNLKHPKEIKKLTSRIVSVYQENTITLILNMNHEHLRIEFLEIVLERFLLDINQIILFLTDIRSDENIYIHILKWIPSINLKEEFHQEIQKYQFDRFYVITTLISRTEDIKLLSEMRLILPSQFLQYIQIQMQDNDD